MIGALTSGGTQFYLTDTLTSVLSTFNDVAGSAIILGNQVYTPYGTKDYTAGSMGTSKGYTGQYEDPTGLDYYNARYYDPVIGQFVTADVKQDNLHGFDPYAYVLGNPETNTDPTGHTCATGDGMCFAQGDAAQATGVFGAVGSAFGFFGVIAQTVASLLSGFPPIAAFFQQAALLAFGMAAILGTVSGEFNYRSGLQNSNDWTAQALNGFATLVHNTIATMTILLGALSTILGGVQSMVKNSGWFLSAQASKLILRLIGQGVVSQAIMTGGIISMGSVADTYINNMRRHMGYA